MLTFTHDDTIFTADYAQKVLSQTPAEFIQSRQAARDRASAQLRQLRQLPGLDNQTIRDLANYPPIGRTSPDSLYRESLRWAHCCAENSKAFYGGACNGMPCGSDDYWFESNVEYPRALAITCYLASGD